MTNLQTCFHKFHEKIALDYGNNVKLIEKREIILPALSRGLRKLYGSRCPKFTPFHQGSYALHTGIKPIEGNDYDIDIGLVFDISKNDYLPTEVKEWVYRALENPPRTVKDKRPCVRVQYHENYEESFHVDLAIYSNPKCEHRSERKHYIAKGYIGLDDENAIWELSQPFELLKLVEAKFRVKEDREQFRRVIRYLKRWKDCNFYSDERKPTGIAITACAYELFQPLGEPKYNLTLGTNRYIPDDLRATTKLVFNILNQFDFYDSIKIALPVEPYNNLFEKMNPEQMSDFKLELERLKDALITAWLDKDTKDACNTLREVFGDDFPNLHKYANKQM